MRINNYILSWDFVLSIILTLSSAIVLPEQVNIAFCLDIYNIGITVLSIIFSLFFTSLAILISSQDEKFILFLEEENDFKILITHSTFTLIALFVSLLISITLFAYTDFTIKQYTSTTPASQSISLVLLFEFCFLYSLGSTILCVLDTIRFSLTRIEFIKQSSK